MLTLTQDSDAADTDFSVLIAAVVALTLVVMSSFLGGSVTLSNTTLAAREMSQGCIDVPTRNGAMATVCDVVVIRR